MKPLGFFLAYFILVVFFTSADIVEDYVEAINKFIEGTNTYELPTDSRSYLAGNNESIINECEDAGTYDFIIVGAGSTGSVLTNRLSEIQNWRVLLIEAGGKETNVSEIPAMLDFLRLSRFNWGYKSVPQNHSLQSYLNHSEWVLRGKALGGSSAINNMMYTRGNPADFDLWASQGNPGWSYGDVLKYFKKLESVHLDRPDCGYRGYQGDLSVEQMDALSPMTYSYLLANKELGREILFDYNGRTQKGFSLLQKNTKRGRRDSGAEAFLRPFLFRDNLDILTNALVVKVLISNKTATGIQYIKNGTSYCAYATKEVILSGGVINSPQMLMLSGIGPKDHLEQLNIEVVHDLPGVGENMWDHIFFYLQAFSSNYTWQDISEQEAVREYLDGKGYLTTTNYNQDIGFVNVYSHDRTRPDIEHIFAAYKMVNHSYEYYRRSFRYNEDIYNYALKPLMGTSIWNGYVILLHPKSRGNIKLKTNSPFDFPLIDPKYFTDPDQEDLKTLVAAYKDTIRISNTESMQRYNSQVIKIDLPACRNHTFESDEYFTCIIQNLASTINHFAGTCKMGPCTDNSAVVDPNLKVYGVKNLRVADCSILPVSISGHPNAAAFMIGEKAGDIIQEYYGVLHQNDNWNI